MCLIVENQGKIYMDLAPQRQVISALHFQICKSGKLPGQNIYKKKKKIK